MKASKQLSVPAKWTDDCQGKKDYDGNIVLLSTRYWPRGGSFWLMGPGINGIQTGEDPSRQKIKPSASASIMINHGEPDEHGFGDYIEVVQCDFVGETEEEVKGAVEHWAQQKMDEIVALLTSHFKTT